MARAFFVCLFAFVGLALARPAGAQSFNAQEQAEIRAVVRDYLVRNPGVLKEALEALEAQTQQERAQRMQSDNRDFSIGPANAPVTVVEFFDYRCPYCHAAADWVVELTRTRRDVRVVFKELPILGPESLEAARAAVASIEQGRYLQFHQALMAERGDLTTERINAIAQRSGLDVTRMRRRMADPAVTDILQTNHGLATDLGVTGTPGFFVNGELIPGFREADLEARINEAARQARGGGRRAR